MYNSLNNDGMFLLNHINRTVALAIGFSLGCPLSDLIDPKTVEVCYILKKHSNRNH